MPNTIRKYLLPSAIVIPVGHSRFTFVGCEGEIALAELEAGRLKIPQVSRVGKAIVEHGDADHIIPYFASAPIDIAIHEKFPTLEQIIDRMNILYAKIRKERKLP
jgi:hypothetical protein